VVAIGNFDGVHAGHRSLLGVAKAQAVECNLPLVALTFEPHPRSVLFPHIPLHRLTDAPTKARLLKEAGADAVAAVAFTLNVASWSPERFVTDVLVTWLKAKVVVVGDDFAYGHKAAGNTLALQRDGRFAVMVLPLLSDAGGVISSRRLRGS
ncbi:MAG: hypothetical protein WAZ18_07435, partial [Alphaproteobacteria bacterium]